MNLRGITGYSTGARHSLGAVTQDQRAHNRNKVLLAPARAAALVLIRSNVGGLATVLYYKIFQFHDGVFWTDVISTWHNKGGDMDSFKNAIKAGYKKRITGIEVFDWIKRRDGALAAKMSKYFSLLYEALNYYKSQGTNLRIRKGLRGIGSPAWLVIIGEAAAVLIPLLAAITALLTALPGKGMDDIYDDSAPGDDGMPPPPPGGLKEAGMTQLMILGLAGAAIFMALKDRPKQTSK